jgi:hypothetical protein
LKVVNALKLYRLSDGAKRENKLSNFDEWTMFWRVITGIEHNQQIPDECLQTLEFLSLYSSRISIFRIKLSCFEV